MIVIDEPAGLYITPSPPTATDILIAFVAMTLGAMPSAFGSA